MTNFKHIFLQNPFINNRLLHSADWLRKSTARVLDRLHLFVKDDKYEFHYSNILYLGRLFNASGKITAVRYTARSWQLLYPVRWMDWCWRQSKHALPPVHCNL